MADEPRRGLSSILNPLPLIAVALVATGVLVKTLPLESSRPADQERRKTAITAAQDVEGRLWQDPFVAVDAELVNLAKEAGVSIQSARLPRSVDARRKLALNDRAHHIERLQERIAAEADGSTEITILGAMVFGGAYPEDTENRRRNRIAVVSGLIASEFAPENADHLGYVWTDTLADPPRIGLDGIDRRLQGMIPYEWYVHRENDRRKVLVVWLEDEAFAESPLNRLSWLVRRLVCERPDQPKAEAGCAYDIERNGMRVVGPAGSDTFASMFAESRAAKAHRHLVRLDFFSPYATIEPSTSDTHGLEAAHAFRGAWGERCSITRTIGGDDALMRALVQELELRGVLEPVRVRRFFGERAFREAAGGAPDRLRRPAILAVTERDTLYANRLFDLLRGAVRNHCGTDCAVMRYSYLRGLDGMLPESAAPAESGRRRDPAPEDVLKGSAPRERATGRGQFDYLRRLADDIDRQLAEAASSVEVKAIAILGNDVYDKLIVLQALRDRFPHAVFFTTDLDARLVAPDQSAWARNLVVASNFGLALHPGLQRGTPPFRDAYQTAGYLATLLALRARGEGPTTEQVHEWIRLLPGVPGATPDFEGKRLFEIGRTRLVELDANGARGDEPCLDLAACRNIHSMRTLNYPGGLDRRAWAVLCLAALLVLLTWRRPQAWLASKETSAAALGRNAGRLIWIVLVALLAAKGIHTFWQALTTSIEQGVGEPFLWTEGVSLWPAQVVRIVSILLSIGFLYCVGRSVRKVIADVEGPAIGIRPDASFVETPRGTDLWLRGPLRPFAGEGLDVAEAGEMRVRIEALWAAFRNRLRPACAWRWIALVTAVIVAITWIFETGPYRPFLPHRGALVQVTDRVLEILQVSLGALVLVTVVYVSRAARAFILRLAERPSLWPAEVSDRFAYATGMPAELLDEWMDFQLLLKLTSGIASLIYYPFVILALGVAARTSFFDATDLPPALVIVVALMLVYALHSAYALRQAAEEARDEALKRYGARIMRLSLGRRGLPEHLRADYEALAVRRQCAELVERIKRADEGAFRPFSQQPIVKAILIPLGSFGGVSVVEYLALANL